MENDMPETESSLTVWRAQIRVRLKPIVLDPQGEAVLTALHQLDFASVTSVRAGKFLEISLIAASAEEASEMVGRMCEKLLANPVIERYDFTVEASRPDAV
jgi:phosphoribosylformylglycinamidine synthase subunit PurS